MTDRFANIPEELKKLKQWVCVASDSKVPLRVDGIGGASSADPDTWATFDDAVRVVADPTSGIDYLGFVFADNGYVGIDIDKGFDEDGFVTVMAADIIKHCHSYTEKSRSGRGFHIIVKGNLPFKGRNNRNGVEIYKTSRYFIMTGNAMIYRDIVENQEALDYIVEKYFPETERTGKTGTGFSSKFYAPAWGSPVVGGNRIRTRPDYPEIEQGCRNSSLASLAGQLKVIGYTKRQIYNELCLVNKIACRPPLPDSELKTICNSIMRYRK